MRSVSAKDRNENQSRDITDTIIAARDIMMTVRTVTDQSEGGTRGEMKMKKNGCIADISTGMRKTT
jgi:hypothetical protein